MEFRADRATAHTHTHTPLHVADELRLTHRHVSNLPPPPSALSISPIRPSRKETVLSHFKIPPPPEARIEKCPHFPGNEREKRGTNERTNDAKEKTFSGLTPESMGHCCC